MNESPTLVSRMASIVLAEQKVYTVQAKSYKPNKSQIQMHHYYNFRDILYCLLKLNSPFFPFFSFSLSRIALCNCCCRLSLDSVDIYRYTKDVYSTHTQHNIPHNGMRFVLAQATLALLQFAIPTSTLPRVPYVYVWVGVGIVLRLLSRIFHFSPFYPLLMLHTGMAIYLNSDYLIESHCWLVVYNHGRE